MKRIIIYFAILTGIIFFPMLWSSEWFQRQFFPEKYWTSQVETREDLVRFYQNQVRSCQLELQKFQRTADIEVLQRHLSGMSGPEARDSLKEEYRITIEVCRSFAQILQDETKDLEAARTELREVRGP